MTGTLGGALLVLAIALPLGATLLAFVLGGQAASRVARGAARRRGCPLIPCRKPW
jgi:hypothetical protein